MDCKTAIQISTPRESGKNVISEAEKQDKYHHDKQPKDAKVSVGTTAIVYFPAKKSGT